MSINHTFGEDKRQNLLIIAFHYPPDNTSTGVLRTLKFSEYLLRHGWHSHVISVPERLYASVDPASVEIIPDTITIERTWACDVKQAFGFRGLYPGWLGVPDRYWPWFFSGTRAGTRAISRVGVDAIYSTYPVPTAHLIALRLKRKFALPWVADFRDPWVENSMPRFRRACEAVMERAVVTSADRIVCNTPAMRRTFLRAYPELSPGKFVTITNGYDEVEMARVVPVRAPRFHIIHPGAIDLENRNPLGLLRGVRRALDNGWLDENDLQVTFLGAGRYGGSPAFEKVLDGLRLRPVVHIVINRIPYRQALAQVAGADVVVVLSENLADTLGGNIQAWTSMQVPVKLYEYLRLGRPLLALVSEGAVRELLESTGAGAPVSPKDTDGIAAALKCYYDARQPAPSTLQSVSAGVAAYSRETLTALLAHELNILMGKGDQAVAPLSAIV